MNKDMKKSLRQAMLSTAAALVSIGFMACSDETFMTQHSTTAPVNGYKISIPANMGAAGTRAIAYNSETGGYDATFEVTDKIFVYNVTQEAEGLTLNPDANGKTANLVGELGFSKWDQETSELVEITPAVGDELMLFYNNDRIIFYYNEEKVRDYAIATVTIESIDGSVIKTSPASFENLQSAYRINFTGISSGVKIKKVRIESEKNNLVSDYAPIQQCPNYFGSVTYTYGGEGTDPQKQTFLLRFADNPNNDTSGPGDVITFKALGSDGHYYIGTKSVDKDLNNGRSYQAEVPVTDAGLALTLTNNTTGEQVMVSYELNTISTKDAAYTLKNTGFNTSFDWDGGNNTLTLDGVTINNTDYILRVRNYEDPDNTKKDHYLVLAGENTLNSEYCPIIISDNNILHISAASADGKLTVNSTNAALEMWNNEKAILESGEVTINGRTYGDSNCSFLIANSGKLRVSKDYDYNFIKAAAGYVLNVSTEGNYNVYTVTEAPAPKDLSVVTTSDLGSVIGSDGKVYVPNCGLPEGVDPVGMIANISSTGHGLAIAMDRVKIRNGNEYDWYDAKSFTWNNAGEYNDGKTATEIFNDWKASNSVSFGTWRFATAADWQQMVLSCRIDGDATEASEEMVAEGLVTQLKKVGIYQGYLECWTGEPGEIEGLWTSIYFDNGYWDEVSQSYQPKQLVIQRWKDPGDNYLAIHPVLEF